MGSGRSLIIGSVVSIVLHVLIYAFRSPRLAPSSLHASHSAAQPTAQRLAAARPRWVSADELLGEHASIRSQLQPRVRCWADAVQSGGSSSRRGVVSSLDHRNCGVKSYAEALGVLGYSLQLHLGDVDAVRLVMLHTFDFGEAALDDDTCVQTLHAMGWIPCVAHPLRPPHPPHAARSRGRFTKLTLFNMLAFDRVLYVDADVLVRHAYGEIFGAELNASAPFAAVRQWSGGEWGETFDDAVLLVRPNASLFTDMYDSLMRKSDVAYDAESSFQGFLAAYAAARGLVWHELPWTVAANVAIAEQAPALWRSREADISAVHFAGAVKPFLPASHGAPSAAAAPLYAWYAECERDMLAARAARTVAEGVAPPRAPPPPPAFQYLAPKAARAEQANAGGTTLVTCFFHLAANKHSAKKYHDWMTLMLTLKDAVVIFTDRATWAEIGPTVHAARAAALGRTAVVFTSIAETRYARKYGVARFGHAARWRAPLLLLWMAKTEFLAHVAEANPFESHDFFWVDIGSYREGKKLGCDAAKDPYCYTGRHFIAPSMRSTLSHTRLLIAIRGHAMTGALFGGTRDAVQRWQLRFPRCVDQLVRSSGVVVGDDQHYYKVCCYRLHDTCEVLKAMSVRDNGNWNTWFFLQPYLSGAVNASSVDRDLP